MAARGAPLASRPALRPPAPASRPGASLGGLAARYARGLLRAENKRGGLPRGNRLRRTPRMLEGKHRDALFHPGRFLSSLARMKHPREICSLRSQNSRGAASPFSLHHSLRSAARGGLRDRIGHREPRPPPLSLGQGSLGVYGGSGFALRFTLRLPALFPCPRAPCALKVAGESGFRL